MLSLAFSSLAKKSTESYKRTWSQLKSYASARQDCCVSLPLSVDLVGLFITHKYKWGNAYSTIATQKSALSYVHKILAMPDPTETHFVKCIMNAVKKESTKKLELLPISLDMLCELILICDHFFSNKYDRCMFKAILLLQYHCCARIGEIVVSGNNTRNTLKLDHLTFDRFGRMVVDFVHYKHDNEECSQALIIQATDDKFSVVTAVLAYLSIRTKGKSSAVFLDRSGSPVDRLVVAKALKNLITCIGLDPDRYDTHSLRAGRACQAAAEGWTETQIKRLGRWKSNAYQKYLRGPLVCS